MAKESYTLETVVIQGNEAQKLGVNTIPAQEKHIREHLPVLKETPEQFRAVLEMMIPGQDIIISDPVEVRARRLNHLNTFDTYIRLAAEYGAIERAPDTPRHMGAIYKPETNQAAIEHNDRLRRSITNKDFKEVGRIFGEHIMNLPSFDPEMIQNLSAEDAPRVLRELYPLYAIVIESKKILGEEKENMPEIRANMSKESLERLGELSQYESLFTALKTQCDEMFTPYYPYVAPSKLAYTQANFEALLATPPVDISSDLRQQIEKLGSNIQLTAIGFGDNTKRMLEKAGVDAENAVAWDFSGKTYPLTHPESDDCHKVYLRNEPVFCTVGNQLKAFRLDGKTVVEAQPEETLKNCFQTTLTTIIQETDSLMNGRTATPRWMFTGSAQYSRMQKAYAAYQKAVDGEPSAEKLSNPKAKAALDALLPAALDYLTHKGVALDDYPDFNSFFYNSGRSEGMKQHELARMLSAYQVLETYNRTTGALKMQEEFSKYPAFKEPLPVKPSYLDQVKQDNEKIITSPFLNTPVPAVGSSNVGEKLQQEVKTALTGSINGLLNKQYFTAQDRQAAEDVLAKTVILSMIGSGRKAATPSAIEIAYGQNAGNTIQMIKKSEAFQSAKGKVISPDGLRKFLTENRQAEVNKNFTKTAVQQKAAANEVQPQPQNNMVLNANVPQQPQQQPAAPAMGGMPG